MFTIEKIFQDKSSKMSKLKMRIYNSKYKFKFNNIFINRINPDKQFL